MSSAADGPPPGHGPDHGDGTEPTSPLGPPPGWQQPGWQQPAGWQQPGWQPQPGWQQPGSPQPGWQQPYGYGYGVPDHPRAATSMVLGIVGLVLCQVVSPFAWVTARRALQEIDASGGRWGGRGQAQAGYVLGIIGTVVLGLAVVGIVVWLLFGLLLFGAAAGNA